MLQLSKFVWTLRSSVWGVLNKFFLIDATDKSKISKDQMRLFFLHSPIPPNYFVFFALFYNLIMLGFKIQTLGIRYTEIL